MIKVFYEVHNELGFGFLESVYASSMAVALEQDGLHVLQEFNVPVSSRGKLVGTFRADMIVERKVVLEFKTAEQVINAHVAQLTHYLRATNFEVGLILNFGPDPRVRRVEFLNERKKLFAHSAFIPS